MSEIEVGSIIRDYEVVKRLGRGGMGQVYLVRHRMLGFERAMKLLRPGQLGEGDAPERFVREASLLSSLHHPNIVAFYEFGALDDGTQFLVMEHLRGAVLWRRIAARGPLQVDEALTSFIGICRGLAEAHRHGIVHRDVSSDNIFFAITPSGEIAKLIDFGIALPTDTATFSRLTQAGMFLGKCAYASPEQLGVGNADSPFDARSDLYALGVVLYESLSGKNPYKDSSLEGIVRRKAAGTPPRLREAVPERAVPEAVDELIQAMLDKDVDQRPQSADAIREVLEQTQRIAVAVPDSTPEPAPVKATHLATSTQVGEYTVESVLGQGGMGTVYQARHRLLGVARALKVVSPKWVRDAAQRERFLREARLLAQLEHPNLVKVYDISPLADSAYYMVQELVDGESLRDRLKRLGPLKPHEAVPLFAAAARGLHACHQAGVVHRDVSPDNIMVVSDSQGGETVKIIDFGIAKSTLSADDAGITSTRTFIGKLEYCSPEQAGKLEPGEDIDGRSDVYSLGVVLYQCLVGKLPFFADTPQGYLAKHLTATPPKPSSIGIALPAGLESLLARMLEKERDRRPETALDLARLLERSLDDAPESTVVLRRDAVAPARRSRGPGIVLAVVAAAAAIGGVLYLMRDQIAPLSDPTVVRSAAIPATPEIVVATPAPTPEPKPSATPSPTPPPGGAEQAKTLVDSGDDLFARERMTKPAGASAFDRYRQALGVDPGNVAATRGLERIRDHFLAKGDALVAKGRFDAARDRYRDAQSVLNDDVVNDRLRRLTEAANPTPVPPTATSTPTPTPSPTPAPAVSNAIMKAWGDMQRSPTVTGVETFLAGNPKLPADIARDAQALLRQLRDEQAFAAIDRSSRRSIEGYLSAFPQGLKRDAASKLLEQLDQDVRDAFAVAERENTPTSYARFLSMHPEARADLRERAQSKEQQLTRADDEAFRQARKDGTLGAFLAYIEEYPRGRHIQSALELFGAPKQGVLALKLVRGAAARDKSLNVDKNFDERQAMDYLGRLGIVPCDGVWDESARLTPDDFRCIANLDPRERSEPYVIDLPKFAELVKTRVRERGGR